MDLNTTMPGELTQPATLAAEPVPHKVTALFKLLGVVALLGLLYLVYFR
jgi:hypothetical protein